MCTHEWRLVQVEAAGGHGLALLWECIVCGVTAYEPSSQDRGR